MKTLNDIIKLMTKVLETLPRYLDLTEKSIRTEAEEIELDSLIHKMEDYKEEISKVVPDYNAVLFNELLDDYYELKHKASDGDIDAIEKFSELKPVFLAPLKDWLNQSLN